MGLWDAFVKAVSDVGNAVAEAANAVAEAVEAVVTAAEEFVADAIETVGNAIADGLGALGDLASEMPGVGEMASGVFHWIGGFVAGVTDLVTAGIKGAFGIVRGVLAGAIRIVGGGIGGLLARDGRVFAKGLGDVASGVAGAVVVVGGASLSLLQGSTGVQGRKEPLTAEQKAMLRRVFRESVALWNVRVVRGRSGVFDRTIEFEGWFQIVENSRPFTLGNTIYLKNEDPVKNPGALVHECTHVWQYQHRGSRYASDALFAQAIYGSQAAYSWEDELARGASRWQDFNAEAEAQLLEDVFDQGEHAGAPVGEGHFYDDDPIGFDVKFAPGKDHTELARKSATYVRDARSWRLSRLLE